LFEESRGLLFIPPLSGKPMPFSHAAVTILLPAAAPQSPALPTNSNGTASSPLPSSADAGTAICPIRAMAAATAVNATVLCMFISPCSLLVGLGIETNLTM